MLEYSPKTDVLKSRTRQRRANMSLFLTRHGECEGNAQNIYVGHIDSPLTQRGKDQALQVAHIVKGKSIERIVSSTLERARETAQIIADELGLEVETDPRLMEYDPGELTGTEIRPEIGWREFTSAGGCEDPKHFAARAVSALREYGVLPGNTLFVAHSGISRLINTLVADLPPEQFEDNPTLENGEVMEFSLDDFAGYKVDPDNSSIQ